MKKEILTITSRKNPLVIDTAALHDKRARDEAGLFLIEGEKLVSEAGDRALPVTRIFLSASKSEELLVRLAPHFTADMYRDLSVVILGDDCFCKISSEKAPQGVIATVKYLDFFKRSTIIYDEDILSWGDARIAMLFGLQDPHNLGAVIRSAVAFGTDTLILSDDCADVYNPKTVRAAMGSLFSLHIVKVSDFASAVRALTGASRRVFAAELRPGAISIADAGISSRDCVLIGNEGHGIPEEISALCTKSVYLPISQNAESLNAAVAASIFFWEQSRTI